MTQPLVFYTNPMSRGRIVRWMLEETGAAYEAVILSYGPAMRTPDYLALNPMGKVPTIRHGDTVVTECAAICAYLADAFPEAGLAPAAGDRGAYYRWLFFGAGPVEAATTNRALGLVPPSDREGMVGYGSYERVLDTLEFAVSRSPFLAGECFSAADVYVGSQIAWGLQFGTIEKRAAFEAYVARILVREAYRRAQALDDAVAAPAPA